jgi:hypothetical protein
MKKLKNEYFILELDGTPYLIDNSSIAILKNLQDVKGDKWLITDFNAGGPKFKNVEAKRKYAEFILQRELRQTGDLESNSQILTQNKYQQNTGTDVLYQIVPSQKFNLLHEQFKHDDNHTVHFTIAGLLQSILKRTVHIGLKVVVFEHARHADFIIGDQNNVVYANRISTYGEDHTAKATLTESLTAHINDFMSSTKSDVESIIFFKFIESLPSNEEGLNDIWIENVAKRIGCGLHILPSKSLPIKSGGQIETSILEAICYLDTKESCLSNNARLSYHAQRSQSWVVLAFASIFFGIGISGLWFNYTSDNIQIELEQIKQTLDQRESAPTLLDSKYIEKLNFAESLLYFSQHDSFKQVLTTLTQFKNNNLTFQKIEIKLDEKQQQIIEIQGLFREPFSKSSHSYTQFLKYLAGSNYKVILSEPTTNVTELAFSLIIKVEGDAS